MEYFDAEKFIKEIEKNPIIWNTNHPSYHSLEEKNRAWTEVANTMKYFLGDHSIESLKKKWKNLRDTYWKTIKASKKRDISGRIRRRKYIYNDLLSFLVTEESTQIEECTINSEPDIIFSTSENDETKAEENCWQQEILPLTIQSENKCLFTRKHTCEEQSDIDDPDRLFLLSLLPMLKSMNEKQNLNFKIQSLKLIKKFKYGTSAVDDVFTDSPYSNLSTFPSPNAQAVPTSVSSSLE